MAFIGNDVVDLTDPGNIGKNRNNPFLQRIFTNAEREYIAAAAEPDVMLWALWAAKEAAYKVASKTDLLAVFTPRLFAVNLFPGDHGQIRSGMVYSPHGPVVIRVTVAPDHLHCIGATPLPGILDHVLWDIERLSTSEEGCDQDPSMAVRRLAGRRLAELLHVTAADIDIRRFHDIDKWGPPTPCLDGQPVPFDLSLSHDGAFVAYAMIPFFLQDHPVRQS